MVPHVLAAFPPQRREQRAFADDALDLLGRQHVVVDAHHLLALAGDDPAAIHAERVARAWHGRTARHGARQSPQRLPALIAYAEPADAIGVAVVEVEPAEDDASSSRSRSDSVRRPRSTMMSRSTRPGLRL